MIRSQTPRAAARAGAAARRWRAAALSLPLLAILAANLTACGDSRLRGARPAAAAAAGPTSTASAREHRYRNDEDKDPIGDGDGDENRPDIDEDYAEDHEDIPRNDLYHDTDDASVVDYGYPATGDQVRAIASVVRAYAAMAAARRADAACALLAPVTARALPQDYGGPGGPPSLRGAKTCKAVLARLFRAMHGLFEQSRVVTAVRVQGNSADALCGSRTAPASVFALVRNGARWRIDSILPQSLP